MRNRSGPCSDRPSQLGRQGAQSRGIGQATRHDDAVEGLDQLLAGAEYLEDYGFNDRVAHRYFCRRCGVHPYEFVDLPAEGRQYYNVNVNCLEALDMDAVMAAPIHYIDGLPDRWDEVPAETRHL